MVVSESNRALATQRDTLHIGAVEDPALDLQVARSGPRLDHSRTGRLGQPDLVIIEDVEVPGIPVMGRSSKAWN